jgi:hypothetical protein
MLIDGEWRESLSDRTEEKTVVVDGRPWHPEPADVGP